MSRSFPPLKVFDFLALIFLVFIFAIFPVTGQSKPAVKSATTSPLVIPQIKNILVVGGRVVIISFHSLEDRIVKNQFKNWGKMLLKKPIAGERGSKLRAYEKI